MKVLYILFSPQLCIFGSTRSAHVSFLEVSTIAFQHLYLCNWDPSYETLPYPPATGQYAIYTIPEFYQYIDYTMSRVSGIIESGCKHASHFENIKINFTLSIE